MGRKSLVQILLGILLLTAGEGREVQLIADIFEEIETLAIRRHGCSIAINGDLVEPQPLFLVPGTTQFWTPTPNGTISIPSGGAIEFHCTQGFAGPFTNTKSIKAKCLSDDVFLVARTKYSFDELICTSQNFHIARRMHGQCFGNSSLIEIGYGSESRFFRTLLVCHDEVNQATNYVHYKLGPSSTSYQRYVPRTGFIQGNFYRGKNLNHLYSKYKQRQTIGDLLSGGHEKYFNEKKSLFLARGHLSAKVDHIFGTQQRTTFYYINAAPQWQSFNAGNWERIEDGVRRLAADRKLELDCFSGTWGISRLMDAFGDHQEIYLSSDENNNGQIPVPMLYYRIVVDTNRKLGIVLIGVNNPHVSMEEIEEEYKICDDVSHRVKWINWRKDDILRGYSYACEVNQFQKVVKHLPKLDVRGLLY